MKTLLIAVLCLMSAAAWASRTYRCDGDYKITILDKNTVSIRSGDLIVTYEALDEQLATGGVVMVDQKETSVTDGSDIDVADVNLSENIALSEAILSSNAKKGALQLIEQATGGYRVNATHPCDKEDKRIKAVF